MAAVVEVEPTPSCSHHSSSQEIEFDTRRANGIKKPQRKKVESDESSESSDEEASERVKLKPPLQKPFQPTIELENREVVFAIAVFLLVGVTLGMVLFICTWKTGADEYIDNGAVGRMCLRTECIAKASMTLNMMDFTADPCVDFYQYACGGWLKRNSIPAIQTTWNTNSEAIRQKDELLKNALESPVEDSNPDSAERKVKELFAKCVDSDAIETQDIGPLMGFINEVGGWAISEQLSIGCS